MIFDENIKTFLYEGRDDMIDFSVSEIPKVPTDFIAQLQLKNGKIINAENGWRKQIWEWWYTNRRGEIENSVLVQASNQMLGRKQTDELFGRSQG